MFYILLQATRPNAGSRNQDSLLLGQFKIPHSIVNEFPVPITGVREGFTLRYSGQDMMVCGKSEESEVSSRSSPSGVSGQRVLWPA